MIRPYTTITVTAPGTPLRVTRSEIDPAASQGCHGVLIQVFPTNVGKIYIGTSNLSRVAPFTGCYAFLAIPTVNQLPTFSAALTLSPNAIQLRDFWIDADNANDGVIVSILVA